MMADSDDPIPYPSNITFHSKQLPLYTNSSDIYSQYITVPLDSSGIMMVARMLAVIASDVS